MALSLATGGLILVEETFTADGTWTRPADLVGDTVYIDMIGGGGSGGACWFSSGSDYDGGNGGDGGSFTLDAYVDVSSIVTLGTVAITVGAGGAASAAVTTSPQYNQGNIGGTSSFGAFLSVLGGGAGRADASNYGQGGYGGGHGSCGDETTYYASNGAGERGGMGSYYGGGGGGGMFSDAWIATKTVTAEDLQKSHSGRGYGAGSYGVHETNMAPAAGAPGIVIVKYFKEAV